LRRVLLGILRDEKGMLVWSGKKGV
jgi:hypothetical protein